MIWLGVLVLWTGRFVVPFLSTYLVSGPGLSVQQATMAVSMYGAGGVVATLVGGMLSDRIGRLPVLMASFVGSAALLLAIPSATTLSALVPVLLAYGFAGQLGGPALSAMVADRVAPDARQRAFVMQVWAMNLGFALGPVIAVRLERISFTLIFVVEAAVCVVVAVFLGATLRERGRFGNAPWAVPATTEATPRLRALAGFAGAVTDRAFVTLVALMLVFTVAYLQSTSTLPLVMTSQGLSLDSYAALLTLNGVLLCALQVPAMRVIERVPPSVALAVGVGVTALGFVVQVFADSPRTYAIAVITWTIGELATFPVASAMVAALAPARLRGTYQGVYGIVWSGAHALAPMLGGFVLAHAGARVMWSGFATAVAAVAVGLLLTARSRQAVVERRAVDEAALGGKAPPAAIGAL
ncbi:MFS transporter [Demequina salsinemoris]|uniref:MFS transporter n=1 Tax=Demequina salsinemoris TaxID=577470 RepID=UPI000781D3DA|nr:MFS transporter [Demequina salsinemoris]